MLASVRITTQSLMLTLSVALGLDNRLDGLFHQEGFAVAFLRGPTTATRSMFRAEEAGHPDSPSTETIGLVRQFVGI